MTHLPRLVSERCTFRLRQHGTCRSSVCGFPRYARKTAHDRNVKYHSAEGSARQPRKPHQYDTEGAMETADQAAEAAAIMGVISRESEAFWNKDYATWAQC